MLKIDKQSILKFKDAAGLIMTKKSELDQQVIDFKENIQSIKNNKAKINLMISKSKTELENNKIKRRVIEKRLEK